jgi:hypothetical protein
VATRVGHIQAQGLRAGTFPPTAADFIYDFTGAGLLGIVINGGKEFD